MIDQAATEAAGRRDPPTRRTDRLEATFWLIWGGQMMSQLGSQLSAFGVSVWAFQATGSVVSFSLVIVCCVLPGLMFMPLAGNLADRGHRKRIMLTANIAAATAVLVLGLLYWNDVLVPWHVNLIAAWLSISAAFHVPAYLSTVMTLVPRGRLGRANGLLQFSGAMAQLLAPSLAGVILASFGLGGIIVLDIISSGIALVTLAMARLPRRRADVDAAPGKVRDDTPRSALHEFAQALRWLHRRPDLWLILFCFVPQQLLAGLIMVMITPLMLTLHSAAVLGTLLSTGASGMLAGSLVMAAWGGPKRLSRGMLCFHWLLGAAVVGAGLATRLPALYACAFVAMFCAPLTASCNQTLWQQHLPEHLRGRLTALRGIVGQLSIPLAALCGGALAEAVFEPLMRPGAWFANVFGHWTGTGPGRGIALMFIVIGLATMAITTLGLLSTRLSRLDDAVVAHEQGAM